MEKSRVFVAIDFPLEVKKEITRVVEDLKKKSPQIRWEKEENLHLTLKFLGWNQNLEEIIVGMEKAVEEGKPFWFRPAELGYFLRESLIVWLGVETQEGLVNLVKNLESEMAKIGFPREKREFSPHITLGRLRHVKPLAKWRQIAQEMSHLPVPTFAKFKVTEIVLMESQLSPKGASYKVLKTVPLSKI